MSHETLQVAELVIEQGKLNLGIFTEPRCPLASDEVRIRTPAVGRPFPFSSGEQHGGKEPLGNVTNTISGSCQRVIVTQFMGREGPRAVLEIYWPGRHTLAGTGSGQVSFRTSMREVRVIDRAPTALGIV